MKKAVCSLCPRSCGAVRSENEGKGVCRAGTLPKVARASLHMWEEPCISGEKGSGAVFFSGCPLKCVFCQNSKISAGGFGKTVTVNRLREIYFELIGQGAHNINLVNPTHFVPAVAESLSGGLPVPVVYNTGGYDSKKALQMLEGLVQVYLPDLKYMDSAVSQKYSSAPDYPEAAKSAVVEMFRQRGPYVLDENGMIKSGVIIRHLVLPENIENTFRVIDWVSDTFSEGDVLFSLMGQYTPWGDLSKTPELDRRLTAREYDRVLDYLDRSEITDGFFQELSSAEEEYIPEFDLRGV